MVPFYPLLTERRLLQPVWGGSRLAAWLDLPQPQPQRLGEAWQVFDTNRILNGLFADRTLAEVISEHGPAVVGRRPFARYGADLPLLAKFINADQDLSIQVHPDDAYAHRHAAASGYHGKNEAWYILDAPPGAQVTIGLQQSVSGDQLRQAALDGYLPDLLRKIDVAAGDLIYVPAGTIHAINAGVTLFEIQQKSDLTYRLYDYQRLDQHGRLRELHLEQALAVSRLQPSTVDRVQPREVTPGDSRHQLLVSVSSFALERLDLDGERQFSTTPDSLEIWTSVSGTALLSAADQQIALPRGASVLLPAALGTFTLHGTATLLRAYVPDPTQSATEL
jgi:mannose-6-phosphate isomerase